MLSRDRFFLVSSCDNVSQSHSPRCTPFPEMPRAGRCGDLSFLRPVERRGPHARIPRYSSYLEVLAVACSIHRHELHGGRYVASGGLGEEARVPHSARAQRPSVPRALLFDEACNKQRIVGICLDELCL